MLGVACLMFILLPTVPPWMAAKNYHLLPPLTRSAGRGFIGDGSSCRGRQLEERARLGQRRRGDAVAARLVRADRAGVLPAVDQAEWLKAVVLLFPVLMLTSLVYLAEHWVIDGLVGWAIVGGSFWFWNRIEDRRRRNRAERSARALATL